MKRIPTILLLAVVLILGAQPILATDQRAEDLLKQARTAIGGEEAVQKIQSMVLKGQYRRVFGEREMTGERELSIMLPDKYLLEDSFNVGGLSTATINTKGLNGERAWNTSSGGSMGHGGIVMRIAGPAGQQASPEQMEALFRKQFGLEFTRYLLATLLMPPPSFNAEYTYAGETEVENSQAEAIDVSDPGNFSVRMFFDKESHLPLLLSYRGPKPRIITAFARPGDGKTADAAKKAQEDAEKKLEADAQSKPQEVDFFIRMTEYKKVNGVLLPHKLTFLTEAEVSEEFEISRYQLNPTLKADKFQKN